MPTSPSRLPRPYAGRKKGLINLLNKEEQYKNINKPKKAVVFCNTKRKVDDLIEMVDDANVEEFVKPFKLDEGPLFRFKIVGNSMLLADFHHIIVDGTSLNILLYEVLAFIICLAILSLALTIITKLTGIIETALKLTVVLALPSKLLGMVVGFIESVVILYVVLFIAASPAFNIPFVNESKYANIILTKTPIVSSVTNDAVNSFNEIAEFTKNEIDMKDVALTNRNIVEIMLKNDLVTTESIELLIEKGKIEIVNANELIEKYKEV